MPDHRSPEAQAYRHLYKTAAWQRQRWAILVRDQFTCQSCGRLEGKTSQLVADHKTPHRGDLDLFWSEANLWTLCKPCHDSAKQSEERTGLIKGSINGRPKDPNHPWNKSDR